MIISFAYSVLIYLLLDLIPIANFLSTEHDLGILIAICMFNLICIFKFVIVHLFGARQLRGCDISHSPTPAAMMVCPYRIFSIPNAELS